VGIVLIIGGGIAGLAYVLASNKTVYTDTATIAAPSIPLAPSTAGVLKQVYVSPGDTIPANTVVAQVGTELVKSTNAGLVITTDTDIGSSLAPGTAVVTMIDPTALRAVGNVDEDKGFADIRVGDRAKFTVDAFPGKTYEGVVDEVAPTSHAADVVFSISDKRQTQSFDVKVAYDLSKYPELKNGMSARIWIFK
jgi:multidrug resistance efflux pump